MPSLARRAVLLPAAIVLLLLASTARAQPLFDELPTLEWRTAQADLVITARILDFKVEFGDYGVSRLGLTLETIETIKGNATPVVEVSIDTPGVLDTVAEGLARRRDSGTIDARFLATRPDTGTFGGIGHGLHMSMLPLTDWPSAGKPGDWLRTPLPPAVTMDLVRHDGKDAVLDALRRIVKNEPPHAESRTPPWGHRLQLSMMSDLRLWPECGNWYHPIVPADARLEALARRMIERPASFLQPLPDTASDLDRQNRAHQESSIRRQGARALAQHFESEENARLLATLLDDTSVATLQPSGLAEPHRSMFTTRKIAFDAHTEWGVEVPEPVLEAPMVNAALAPSPAAMHAVHGPDMEGLVSVQFLIELGGDRTPELLRLTYLEATGNAMAADLESLRAAATYPIAFTVFAFAENEAIPVFHAAGDMDGFPLRLGAFGGHPALVYQSHTKDPLVYACGWWPIDGDFSARQWMTHTGVWKDGGTDIEFSGRGPSFWRANSK